MRKSRIFRPTSPPNPYVLNFERVAKRAGVPFIHLSSQRRILVSKEAVTKSAFSQALNNRIDQLRYHANYQVDWQ